jgi:hypothetical protein
LVAREGGGRTGINVFGEEMMLRVRGCTSGSLMYSTLSNQIKWGVSCVLAPYKCLDNSVTSSPLVVKVLSWSCGYGPLETYLTALPLFWVDWATSGSPFSLGAWKCLLWLPGGVPGKVKSLGDWSGVDIWCRASAIACCQVVVTTDIGEEGEEVGEAAHVVNFGGRWHVNCLLLGSPISNVSFTSSAIPSSPTILL